MQPTTLLQHDSTESELQLYTCILEEFFFYHGIQTYFIKDALIDLNHSLVINVMLISRGHML